MTGADPSRPAAPMWATSSAATDVANRLRLSPRVMLGSKHFPCRDYAPLGFFGRASENGQMAHLPAWSRRGLTVQVEFDVPHRQRRRPVRFALGPDIAE